MMRFPIEFVGKEGASECAFEMVLRSYVLSLYGVLQAQATLLT